MLNGSGSLEIEFQIKNTSKRMFVADEMGGAKRTNLIRINTNGPLLHLVDGIILLMCVVVLLR